jgi:hypothetical protein
MPAHPPNPDPAPVLELVVELQVLDLRVVEDREARVELEHRVGGRRGPVVSGQGVGVAHEDRVPVGHLTEEVDVGAERASHLDLEVREAVECGGDEAVGLDPAVDLALELRGLPDQGVEGRPVDRLE